MPQEERPNAVVIFYAETGVVNGGDETTPAGYHVAVADIAKDGTVGIRSDGIGPFNTYAGACEEGQTLLDDWEEPFVPKQGEPYVIG